MINFVERLIVTTAECTGKVIGAIFRKVCEDSVVYGKRWGATFDTRTHKSWKNSAKATTLEPTVSNFADE